MPLNVGNPTTDVELFFGYNPVTGTFFFSDPQGGPTALVELMQGHRGDAVSWLLVNKTDRRIFVSIDGFKKSGAARCPVALPLCRVDRQEIIVGARVLIQSALLDTAEFGRYTYEVAVSAVETSRGDVLDPELQIDE